MLTRSRINWSSTSDATDGRTATCFASPSRSRIATRPPTSPSVGLWARAGRSARRRAGAAARPSGSLDVGVTDGHRCVGDRRRASVGGVEVRAPSLAGGLERSDRHYGRWRARTQPRSHDLQRHACRRKRSRRSTCSLACPMVLRSVRRALHPISVLSALITYRNGRGARGQTSWEPITAVVDALDSAFYASFANVDPAGKRTLLALDVSGSMTSGVVAGVVGLSPRVASAAMAAITLGDRAEGRIDRVHARGPHFWASPSRTR